MFVQITILFFLLRLTVTPKNDAWPNRRVLGLLKCTVGPLAPYFWTKSSSNELICSTLATADEPPQVLRHFCTVAQPQMVIRASPHDPTM